MSGRVSQLLTVTFSHNRMAISHSVKSCRSIQFILKKHDIKNMMRMLIKHDPSHDTQGAVHDSDVTKLNCFSSEFDRLTLRSISWHAAGGFLARFWNWACSVRHVAWQA